jgi:TolB-like protein/Flp pilus assembly protein TadD
MNDSNNAVFLSYASEDAPAAQRICEALRAASIEVWFDQSELRGGDAWDNSIRTQIKACALFIPIISKNSRVRAEGYFRLEWKLAVDRSHLMAADKAFLLPVVIDATQEADARVPDRFREMQWSRLPEGETSPAFVERVQRLLSPESSPGPARAASPESGAQPASGSAPVKPRGSPYAKIAVAVVVALMVVALAYLVVDKYRSPNTPATPPPAIADSQPALASGANAESSAAASAVPAAISERSIAVMPFVDMSEKKDQEYFSDGLSEELIGMLSKIPDLRVPASSSSFFFKGKPTSLTEIGRTLRVANVLEGSVRKSGNQLRITAQLTRVDTGYQIWTESYDREFKDIFKVQRDIAASVVKALQLKLAPDAGGSASVTPNSSAYNLFLQGQYFVRRANIADTQKGIELLKRSLLEEPRYAPAHAELASAYIFTTAFGTGGSAELEAARKETEAALRYDPTLATAYTLSANLALIKFDWAATGAQVGRALALEPNNPWALFIKGTLARVYGHVGDAIGYYRRALELNPLEMAIRLHLAFALQAEGRTDEARAEVNDALAISPNAVKLNFTLGMLELAQGRTDAARADVDREAAQWYRLTGQAIVADAQKRTADADAALKQLIDTDADSSAVQIAQVYAMRKDFDAAFRWLDRSYAQHDPGLVFFQTDPLLINLRGDPRYAAMRRKLNL